jgi:uncharacterized protein
MIFERFSKRIFHPESLSVKHVLALFSFIFSFWAFYRYFPEVLPIWVEEFILKPIIWLGPLFWLVFKIEKQDLTSLGITKKNLFKALYWGIGLGFIFAFEGLLTNVIKYKGFQATGESLGILFFLGSILTSFATAFSEETVFRGYIFNRLCKIWDNELLANVVSSFLFTVIHLPIGIFVLGYKPLVMLAYLVFVFIFGFGSSFVFARSKNLASSILLHVFWSWPIILFK